MSWQNWLQIGVLVGLIGVTAPLVVVLLNEDSDRVHEERH